MVDVGAIAVCESDIGKIILENHFDIVEILGNIGMLWWVSTTLLCIGMLKTAWDYKVGNYHEIPNEIIWFISLFFGSIFCFGLTMSYMSVKLEEEFNHIIGPIYEYRYPTGVIFDFPIYGYFIGSTTFFLFFCCWLYIIIYKKEHDNK